MPSQSACLSSNQILDVLIIFLGPATILTTLATHIRHRAPCTAPRFLTALLAWALLCLLWLYWRWNCLSWLSPASEIERVGLVSNSGSLTMLPPSNTTGVAMVVWSLVIFVLFFAVGLFVLAVLGYCFMSDFDREHKEDLRRSFSWEGETRGKARSLSMVLEWSKEVRKWKVEVGSGLLKGNERWNRDYGTMKGGLEERVQLLAEEDGVL